MAAPWTPHNGLELKGMGATRQLLKSLAPMAVLILGGFASPAIAHHPGGIAEPLVLIDARKEGFRTVLEVFPPDPVAGSLTQFMLWVTPERWGYDYRGAARLWIQDQSPSPAPPMVLPLPEEGRRAGVYLAEHRFDQGGSYRVVVELDGLPARWTGSLQVESASAWLLKLAKPVALGGLVVVFMLLLQWWSRREGATA